MKKQDILAQCIDEILSGRRTMRQCLLRYPWLGEELQPLLKIATSIRSEKATASQEFRERARRKLLEAMEPSPTRAGRPAISDWLKPAFLLAKPRFSVAVAIFASIVVIGGGGTVYASQGSLPDDMLYPLKTGVEGLQLALAQGHEARAWLHLKLAERRADEVVTQSNLGRTLSTSALGAIASQIDSAVGQIGMTNGEDTRQLLSRLSASAVSQEVKLSQITSANSDDGLKMAIDVTRRAGLVARVAYSNPSFLKDSPSVLKDELETSYFKLEGVLMNAEGDNWNIGGLSLRNINSSLQVAPRVGDNLMIEGIVWGNRVYLSKVRVEHDADTTGQVKVNGIFGGTSSDGTTWYVGGVPVTSPDVTPPPRGRDLQLEGAIQNGSLVVSQSQSEDDGRREVRIPGTVDRVNSDDKAIIVDIAGAKVKVNVGEASVKGQDGKALALSELSKGDDVSIRDVKIKDGKLHAGAVYTENEPKQSKKDKSHQEEDGKGAASQSPNDKPDEGKKTGSAEKKKDDGDDGNEKSPSGESKNSSESKKDSKSSSGERDRDEDRDEHKRKSGDKDD
ncbi:MAG: hypothetical protein HYX79_05910 [Chloroflexi bacterium]|nr:hypothetical protein [Chloroflexota bacterium]